MKWISSTGCLVAVLIAGCAGWKKTGEVTESIVYRNEGLGLSFTLAEDWRGYSVLMQRWQAAVHNDDGENIGSENGPEIVVRHPQWRPDDRWQDIPILVFTRRQWADEHAGQFFPYAGGMIYELGHNDRYVFGIYSRFNADDSVKGAAEAGEIAQRNLGANTSPLYPE
jgi:hypothetical protein